MPDETQPVYATCDPFETAPVSTAAQRLASAVIVQAVTDAGSVVRDDEDRPPPFVSEAHNFLTGRIAWAAARGFWCSFLDVDPDWLSMKVLQEIPSPGYRLDGGSTPPPPVPIPRPPPAPKPDKPAPLRLRIVEAINAGYTTAGLIARHLGAHGPSVYSCITELKNLGIVEKLILEDRATRRPAVWGVVASPV